MVLALIQEETVAHGMMVKAIAATAWPGRTKWTPAAAVPCQKDEETLLVLEHMRPPRVVGKEGRFLLAHQGLLQALRPFLLKVSMAEREVAAAGRGARRERGRQRTLRVS